MLQLAVSQSYHFHVQAHQLIIAIALACAAPPRGSADLTCRIARLLERFAGGSFLSVFGKLLTTVPTAFAAAPVSQVSMRMLGFAAALTLAVTAVAARHEAFSTNASSRTLLADAQADSMHAFGSSRSALRLRF